MKHYFFLPMAGAALLWVLVGCGGPERRVLRGGTEHMPLRDGRVLKFEERQNGKTTPYTVRMRYAGGNTVRVFEVEFDGLDRGYCNFISKESQVQFSTDKPTAPLDLLPEYRELWVDETLEPGTSWMEEDVAVETIFTGFETVTVPAGTYKDCYKTVTTVIPAYADSVTVYHARGEITVEEMQKEAALVGTYTVRWFAPGVGLIKEQFNGSDHVRELVEIVEEGTGEENALPDSVINITPQESTNP